MISLPEHFRVVVTERRSGTVRDVTSASSDLKYTIGLPGGYKTLSFRLATVDAEGKEVRPVRYLDDIVVYYADDVAWEGQVEELNPAEIGTVINALGYSATTRVPLGVLFVDRSFERWMLMDQLQVPSILENPSISFIAPTLQGTDGAVAQFAIPSGTTLTIPFSAERKAIYIPPWGTTIRNFRCKYRALAPGLPAGPLTYYLYPQVEPLSNRNAPAGGGSVPTRTPDPPQFGYTGWVADGIAREGQAENQAPTVDGAFLHLTFTIDPAAGSYTPSGDAYFRWYDQRIAGELHPDTAATLRETETTIDVMLRSLLVHRAAAPRLSSSSEMMTPGDYVFQQATFDDATFEEIAERFAFTTGWEWGVFRGRRVHVGPATVITAAPGSLARDATDPPWYLSLREEEGHRIDATESAASCVNEVQVKAIGVSTGIRAEQVYTNYDDGRSPLNSPGGPPLEVRRRVVQVPDGIGESDWPKLAAAYLDRFAAPKVVGKIVLGTASVPRVEVGTTTPFLIGVSEIGGPDTFGDRRMGVPTKVPSPLVLPGYWVHLPDVERATRDAIPTDSAASRRAPGGVAMIRLVEVDAASGRATVTLTLDDGDVGFETQLARLQEE